MCEWRLLDHEWEKNPIPLREVYHLPALRRDSGLPFSLISCPQPNVCSEKLTFPHPLLSVWDTGERSRKWSFCLPGELCTVQIWDPSPGFSQDQFSFESAVSPSIKGLSEEWGEGWEILLVKILYALMNLEGLQNTSV